MQRHERPIHAFRRRLLRLIDEQYDGRYTILARRAGVPITTMQHYVHTAKRLPGGEHLMRLAAALGVTVEQLVAGPAGVRPTARPVPRIPVIQFGDDLPVTPSLAIPVFRCGCPGACPLTGVLPPVTPAISTVLLPAEMLPTHQDRRLIALQVGAGLEAAEWPGGSRLVMDADARTPPWEALAVIHIEGRCQVGHLTQLEGACLVGARIDDCRMIMEPGRILGTIVAVVAPLAGDLAPPGQIGETMEADAGPRE